MLLSRMSPLMVFLVEGKHGLLPASSQATWNFPVPEAPGQGPPSPALPTAGRLGALRAAALVEAWKAPRWFNFLFTAPRQGDTFFPEASPALICDGEGQEKSWGDLGTETIPEEQSVY